MNKNRKSCFKSFFIFSVFAVSVAFMSPALYSETESPSGHERSQPSTGSASEVNSNGGEVSTAPKSQPRRKSNGQKSYKSKKSYKNENGGYINDENGNYQR